MIRSYIHYGGLEYIVGHETADEVKSRVEEILASGSSGWLRVNYGDGRLQSTDLLIGPGIPFAVYTGDDAE